MEFKEYECKQCKNQFVDDLIEEARSDDDINCPVCGSKDVENCGTVSMLDYFRQMMSAGGG